MSIQVKSRYYSSAGGFPIKTPKADFVVFAHLNLDLSLSKGEARPPECYVFPAAVIRLVIEVGPSGTWHKCHLKRIAWCESYREAWDLIALALREKAALKQVRSKARK